MSDFPSPDAGPGFAVTITSADPMMSLGTYVLACAGGGPGSNTWPVANKAIFVPFLVQAPMVAVKMFTLNGATAAGNQDVGIYDVAGNRLVSIGSTAQAGTNAMQVHDITDTALSPGRYYMALVNSGTTGTYAAKTSIVAAACGGGGLLQMATALPLPDPATYAAASSAYFPFFGLTARVLT